MFVLNAISKVSIHRNSIIRSLSNFRCIVSSVLCLPPLGIPARFLCLHESCAKRKLVYAWYRISTVTPKSYRSIFCFPISYRPRFAFDAASILILFFSDIVWRARLSSSTHHYSVFIRCRLQGISHRNRTCQVYIYMYRKCGSPFDIISKSIVVRYPLPGTS